MVKILGLLVTKKRVISAVTIHIVVVTIEMVIAPNRFAEAVQNVLLGN